MNEEQLSVTLQVINGEKYISLKDLDRILLWDISITSPVSKIRAYIKELRKRISTL